MALQLPPSRCFQTVLQDPVKHVLPPGEDDEARFWVDPAIARIGILRSQERAQQLVFVACFFNI